MKIESQVKRAAMIFSIVGVIVFLLYWKVVHKNEIIISFEVVSEVHERSEVFTRNRDHGYEIIDSAEIDASKSKKNITLLIRDKSLITNFRLDPMTEGGRILIKPLQVSHHSLAKKEVVVQDLRPSALINGELLPDVDGFQVLESIGDPQFYYRLPDRMVEAQIFEVYLIALGSLLVSAICGCIWYFKGALYKILGVASSNTSYALDSIVSRMNSLGIPVFSRKSISLVAATFFIAIIFVALKLHQSSIGMYEGLSSGQVIDHSISIGSPKAIRSDEWNTQTPWVLNQAQRITSINNPNVGGPGAAFLVATPTLSPLSIFHVKFWGVYLFDDLELAFSWIWAYKLFALLVSFFVLFLLLTEGNTFFAAIGAWMVLSASFVQWWFSSHLPEILIAYCATTIGIIYLHRASSWKGLCAGAAALVFGAVNLVLHIYPAFIIPLVALLAPVLIFSYVSSPTSMFEYPSKTVRAIFTALSALIVIACIVVWWDQGRAGIDLLRNTVYPGNVIRHFSPIDPARLFYGFFEGLRFSENVYPLPPTNSSEAGSFSLLFIIILLVIPVKEWIRSSLYPAIFLLLFLVFLSLWMVGALPDFINKFLEYASHGYMVPERSIIALGIGSIILFVVVIDRSWKSTAQKPFSSIALAYPVTVVALGLYAAKLNDLDPTFFTLDKSILGVLLFSSLVYSLCNKDKVLLCFVVACIGLQPMLVNPLQSGLASIFKNNIFKFVLETDQERSEKWAVFGSFSYAQGLKAVGLNVINGSHYVPALALHYALDPSLESRNIWNRYAHVSLNLTSSDVRSRYTLLGTDHILITVDVCSDEFIALGVSRILIKGGSDVPICLEPIGSYQDVHVLKYKGSVSRNPI